MFKVELCNFLTRFDVTATCITHIPVAVLADYLQVLSLLSAVQSLLDINWRKYHCCCAQAVSQLVVKLSSCIFRITIMKIKKQVSVQFYFLI